jgi:hypothetical protein
MNSLGKSKIRCNMGTASTRDIYGSIKSKWDSLTDHDEKGKSVEYI